ncbi:MAG TPA: hypothetical protein VLS47_05965 [Gallionella sp.]|nr:hypothetical protein [Gallionella sp.]
MNDQSGEVTSNTSKQDDNPFQVDLALSVIFSVTIAAWSCLIVYSIII